MGKENIELEKAMVEAVAKAFEGQSVILKDHEKIMNKDSLFNQKVLLTGLLSATMIGLFGWVFSTSNRVSLLENNMQRLAQDIVGVSKNVEKVLEALQVIQTTRFTPADFQDKTETINRRLDMLEESDNTTWKVMREHDVAIEKLKNNAELMKEKLDRVYDK